MTKPLRYVEMPAAPALSGIVATYWGFTIRELPHPGFTHHVWPDGCATLAICSVPHGASVAALVGASVTASSVAVHPGEQYWGIRFRPEAGGVCCGRSAQSLRDQRLDAHELFGTALTPLISALARFRDADDASEVATIFDRWSLDTIGVDRPIDALVQRAVDAIVAEDGTGPITDMAEGLGVTVRQLQRRFRAATGLTPKEYASVRRGRAALKRLVVAEDRGLQPGLAQVAFDSGYADQAHLTREVGRLTTLTPTMLAERLDDIAHDHLVD
ncbi:helix-turn-helix transcriptional regulator [Gemmatimonas groenlandica]|uniref:Helix-turn-helix transcriptional regulator n=1 Tax=Gemmatimonas groenlandica TaxID=2732249 RepID=A0A6M4IL57_9BACT|nr:helix-turn-helix transcriptional regulator [Gemmatimonas groenlandica]QJR35380.1 helix-turn-helix transcriptional regulator [Gemmatimonas groenlandica]